MNAQDQQVRIKSSDLELAKDLVCDECGHNTFVLAFMIKSLSAIVSPTGQEINLPIQTYACSKCGHVNKKFMPDNKT